MELNTQGREGEQDAGETDQGGFRRSQQSVSDPAVHFNRFVYCKYLKTGHKCIVSLSFTGYIKKRGTVVYIENVTQTGVNHVFARD